MHARLGCYIRIDVPHQDITLNEELRCRNRNRPCPFAVKIAINIGSSGTNFSG